MVLFGTMSSDVLQSHPAMCRRENFSHGLLVDLDVSFPARNRVLEVLARDHTFGNLAFLFKHICMR